MSGEFVVQWFAVARGVDNAIVSGGALLHSLKDPPPFGGYADGRWIPTPLSAGVARYGAGPLNDLWLHMRDMVALRVAWTGHPYPEAPAAVATVQAAPVPPVEEPVGPDEAVPVVAADDGAADQPRLGGA